MKSFVLPRMPLCLLRNPESRECTKDLRTTLKEGNGRLGKTAIDTLDSPICEGNGCFKGLGKETRIYTRSARLIAVKERMLEFYSD